MEKIFIMPEKAHPVNNLEQKMIELNVMLYESFGSFKSIFEFIQDLCESIPEGADRKKMMKLILHFRCLDQIAAIKPGFSDIIDERNSYKDGTLP